MFTGIVQDVGQIVGLDKQGDWTVTIATKLPLAQTSLGASVACNGICLTIIKKEAGQFTVQVSMETLSKTTALHWQVGKRLNLEPALRMGDELGGHLLSGHIDGVARIIKRSVEKDSLRYVVEVPHMFEKYMAAKGSVALDGVSLTINQVENSQFDVNIIPHTQTNTNLADHDVGHEVNFEIDMIARYVERMTNQRLKP